MADTHSPSPPAPAKATRFAPLPMWGRLAYVDRRAWMAVGGLAAAASVIGGAMGLDLHRSAMVPVVLMAAAAVATARVGWSWMRGGSRRARLRESALTRVEQYGGGVYGTGAGMTLLVLSAISLQEDIAKASGLMDFLRGMTMEWWIGFSGDSIANAVMAGIWPIHWFSNGGMPAVLAVAAAAWLGDALADRWRQREPLATGRQPANTAAAAG